MRKIDSVFPAQDTTNLSRKALTDNIDTIAGHRTFVSQLRRLLSLLMDPLILVFIIVSIIRSVRELGLGFGILAIFALGFVLWTRWVTLLIRSRLLGERVGSVVLAYVLPAGMCLVPKALVYTGIWSVKQHRILDSAIVEGTFSLSLALSINFILILINSALIAEVNYLQQWRNPRPLLLNSLFQALWQTIELKKDAGSGSFEPDGTLLDHGAIWADPEARVNLVAWLETAAKCLQVIPKRISGLDRFSSTWNLREYLRRASGIRNLKKWVLLPKPETRDYLERELRRILLLTAIGDWDGLPQEDLPQDAPVAWWRRALRLVRSIIIAAIPLVAVFIFGDKLPEGDFRKYVTGLASIWAVVHLLAAVDPRFGEKLSALKDLPSFFPFGGKSKE